MPVEWLYFSAERMGDKAQLKWGTARELNSFYFGIERSVDGRVFESLDQVQAAGFTESVTEYTYTDVSLSQLSVPAVLYRLRQVDLDGQFEYSNLVELKLDGSPAAANLVLYPNPASERVSVRLTTASPGDWNLKVLNLNGQVVHNQRISTMGGRQEIPLDCIGWAAGYYVVNLSDGVQNLAQKLQVK